MQVRKIIIYMPQNVDSVLSNKCKRINNIPPGSEGLGDSSPPGSDACSPAGEPFECPA